MTTAVPEAEPWVIGLPDIVQTVKNSHARSSLDLVLLVPGSLVLLWIEPEYLEKRHQYFLSFGWNLVIVTGLYETSSSPFFFQINVCLSQ